MSLTTILSPFLVAIMAFTVGFAIRRGSVCLVNATYQWIVQRKVRRLKAFVIAAAASGSIILPLSWVLGGGTTLAPSTPVSLLILISGVIFGLGARINGGCAFGTLNRLSGGDLNFSGTIAGAVCAAYIMPQFKPAASIHQASIFSSPWPWGIIALIVFAVLTQKAIRTRHLRNLKSIFVRNNALLRPFSAMLVIGVFGGLLFSLAGSWTHLAILTADKPAFSDGAIVVANAKPLVGAVALICGALFAAIRSGRFKWHRLKVGQWFRCFAGGLAMSASASLIPGGNGAVLLYAMPSGALSGWAAFAMMLTALIISFAPMRKRQAN